MNSVLTNVGISFVFGIVGIVLLVFGYWFFDLVLTKLDFNQELKEKNVAVAIVVGHEKYIGTKAGRYARMIFRRYFQAGSPQEKKV